MENTLNIDEKVLREFAKHQENRYMVLEVLMEKLQEKAQEVGKTNGLGVNNGTK